jgi:hypothetical protein
MTDAVLWSAFVALLSGALFFAWPRPPAWDPVLFHHMVLATLLRAEVEGVDGKLADWQARLDAVLPRGPRPPPGGWTVDPALLGPDYDLVQRLGAEATWDALAEGAPAVEAARDRRLGDVVLAWVGEPALAVPGVRSRTLASADLGTLLTQFPEPHQRFVLATRAEGPALLAALRDAPAVRDRVRACLFVGAEFDPAWLAANLTHLAFDTELDRTVPWFVLRTAEAPEALLAEPEIPPTGRRSIAVHDLGVVAVETLSEPAAGRAMALLVAALA